jgi:D-sedoheptulose 7-phosphate isomerase
MNSNKLQIEQQIKDSSATISACLEQSELIANISSLVIAAFRNGHKLFLFGNGGSASDAEHIATELSGRFKLERPSLPALSLTANTSTLTAIANDYGFEMLFSRQLEGLATTGDVVIGISTSGNSPNVINGLKFAKSVGATTIAMTGKSGGKLKEFADYCLCIPSDDTPRIQEAHIMIGHILCDLVEKDLFELKQE